MKLDFVKAYNAMVWEFMFQAMTTIGIHPTVILMTRVLFQKANAVVNINGQSSKSFEIRWGVGKCPLVPYVFLIMGEFLNHMVNWAIDDNEVKGIGMSRANVQQIVAQYTDDMSFAVEGDEQVVRNLVRFLRMVCSSS